MQTAKTCFSFSQSKQVNGCNLHISVDLKALNLTPKAMWKSSLCNVMSSCDILFYFNINSNYVTAMHAAHWLWMWSTVHLSLPWGAVRLWVERLNCTTVSWREADWSSAHQSLSDRWYISAGTFLTWPLEQCFLSGFNIHYSQKIKRSQMPTHYLTDTQAWVLPGRRV